MKPPPSQPDQLGQLDQVLIDSHLHAVSPDRTRYPLRQADLPGNSWVHTSPASAEDLLAAMADNGVQGGVLVQPVGAYGTDNSYVADAVAALSPADSSPASAATSASPQLAAVCVIDMTAADRLEQLRYWTQQRQMGGVRFFSIPTPEVAWLDNPETFDVWEACVEWGVRVSVCILPAELENLGRVLQRFPELPVALDHCGFADVADGPPWNQAAPLFELADYENLHLKVTTNVLEAAIGGQPQATHPNPAGDLLLTLCRHFGSQRLLWGSDYPQTHNLSYPQLVALAQDASAVLPSQAQADYLGLTARRLWPELG